MARDNRTLDREWEVYVKMRYAPKDTSWRYIRNTKAWLAWLGQRRRNALDATPKDALDFWQECSPGLSSSTLKQRLTSLHAFYKWLQLSHACRDPFNAVPKIPRQNPRPRETVSPDQLVALVRDWTPRTWHEMRDQAFIATLVSTGARVSECCNMNTADIDSRRKAVQIPKGKGDKFRWCALVGGSFELVESYIEGVRPLKLHGHREPALWLNNHGNRLKPESARALVKRLCARLGIDVNLTPHGVRASAITALWEGGADVVECKDFAGHTNISTTVDHYIKRSPQRVIEVAKKYHPLETKPKAKKSKREDDEN